MKKIDYKESDFSLEDLEKINECREWVDDYIDLNARRAATPNKRRTVLYWKKVFEETLPSFLLEKFYDELSGENFGLARIPFIGDRQLSRLQEILDKYHGKILYVIVNLNMAKYHEQEQMRKREAAYPTPKTLNEDTINRYKIEQKLIAPTQTGTDEWAEKMDKVPGYLLTGRVLQNIQPLEEISDGGFYKLKIYGKVNGSYPAVIFAGSRIEEVKLCNSMQEAYEVGLSELKKVSGSTILPNGR